MKSQLINKLVPVPSEVFHSNRCTTTDKLPPEILCDIFLKTLPGEHVITSGFHRDSILAPLSISHVCRTWRDLAFSFGELWCHLQMNLWTEHLRDKVCGRRCTVEIFDTWLSRSKGSPLSYDIYFNVGLIMEMSVHRDAEYIITTLSSQQHRWKDIHLSGLGLRASPEFPGLILTNMPMLTSLTMFVDTLERVDIDITRALRLRKIVIRGVSALKTGNTPIHTITEPSLLTFCSSSEALRSCLDFLRISPFLTEFDAYISQRQHHTTFHLDNEEPALLYKLHVLVLRSDDLLKIIGYLTLPSLEDLSFSGVALENEANASPLRTFFQRSHPPLTTLEIRQGNADYLIASLQLLPTLKKLKIEQTSISERFLRGLSNSDDTNGHHPATDAHVICPRLVFLEFFWTSIRGDVDTCLDILFSMVKFRAEVLGTFTTAEVTSTLDFPMVARETSVMDINAVWNMDLVRSALIGGTLVIRGTTSCRPIRWS